MIYEDLAVAYEHIACCEEIAVSDLNLYKYYRRPGSIVNSSYSDRLLNFYKAMEWNRAYVERDYPDDPEMKKAGYPNRVIGAIAASSGTLGVVIPPSIAMVTYCLVDVYKRQPPRRRSPRGQAYPQC